MIIGHLQERSFADWAMDPTDALAVAHLNQCEACRKEAVDFRNRIAAFREALFVAGDERRLAWAAPAAPELRWMAISDAVRKWVPRLVMATLVVAFAMVTYRPRPVAPPPSTEVDDQTLMMHIDEDLSRPAPEALAPAEVAWSETDETPATNRKAGH